jgi:predicted nucleotidyltransferase
MCDKPALNEIMKRIAGQAKSAFGDKLDKVILYGSYARGDYDNESDIDVMVIADIKHDDCLRAYEDHFNSFGSAIDLEYDVLTSIHVLDSATFYYWLDVVPFYKNVMREGVAFVA